MTGSLLLSITLKSSDFFKTEMRKFFPIPQVLILYLLFLLLNSSDTVNGAPLPEISKSPTTTQAVIRDALIEGCSGLSWSPIRGG